MELRYRAYAYLIISLLVGSFTPVLLTLTNTRTAPELFLLASLFSIPFGIALVVKNRKVEKLAKTVKDRRKFFYLILAVLLLFVPYEYGISYSEHFITASLATVLFRLNPLLMLLFLPVVLRERLSRRQVIALVLGLAGVIIAVTSVSTLTLASSMDLSVIALVVLLALGYAFANVVIKWKMIDGEVFVAASGPLLAVFFLLLFLGSGAYFTLPSAQELSVIVYLGLTNVFSFYMYLRALKMLKTTLVTNTFLLSPFFTILWASALFGEQVKAYYLAIAILVGIGIFLQRNDEKGGSYIAKKSVAAPYKFVLFDVTGAFSENIDARLVKIINSGGRFIATKLNDYDFEHGASIFQNEEFMHVYTGEEPFIAKEGEFVKNVLGLKVDERMIIKAGSDSENDEFFDKLNHMLSTVR